MPSSRNQEILADVISRAVRFKIDAELAEEPKFGSKTGSLVYGLAAFAAASAFSKVVGKGKSGEPAGGTTRPSGLLSVERETDFPVRRRGGDIQALLDDSAEAEHESQLRSEDFEREERLYEARLAELRASVAALVQERSKLESEAGEAEATFSQLGKKIDLAERELKALGERKERLEEQARELEESIRGTEENGNGGGEHMQRLRDELEELRREYRRHESGAKYALATRTSLESDRRALVGTHDAVRSQLSSARMSEAGAEEVGNLEDSERGLARRIEEVDREIRKYTELADSEREDADRIRAAKEEREAELARMEGGAGASSADLAGSSEIDERQGKLEEVRELLRASDAQVQELETVSKKLRHQLEMAEGRARKLQLELDDATKREEMLLAEIAQLNEVVDRHREAETRHRAEKEEDRLEVERMRARIEALEQQKKSLADELSVYQTGAHDLERQYGDTKRRLDESSEREKKLEGEISELKQAIERLGEEREKLSEESHQLVQAQTLMASVAGERERAERELGEASAQLKSLTEELERRKGVEAQLAEAKESILAELESKERERASVERELRDGQQREAGLNRQVSGLEQTVQNLTAEVERWKELRSELDMASTASSALEESEARLRSQLDHASKRESEARERVAELESVARELESTNSDLRDQLDSLSREFDGLKELRSELEGLESGQAEEIIRLRKDLVERKSREEELAGKVAELEHEVERRGKRIWELEESEKALLRQLEENEGALLEAVEARRRFETELHQLKEAHQRVTVERDGYEEKARSLELSLEEVKQRAGEKENAFGERIGKLEQEIEIRDQQLKALLDDTRPSELTEVQPLSVPSSKKRFTKNFDVVTRPPKKEMARPDEREREVPTLKAEDADKDVFSQPLGTPPPLEEEARTGGRDIEPKKFSPAGQIPESRERGKGELEERSYTPDRSFDSLVEDSRRRSDEKSAKNPEDKWKKEEGDTRSEGAGAKWLALLGGGAVIGVGAAAAMLYLDSQKDMNSPEGGGESKNVGGRNGDVSGSRDATLPDRALAGFDIDQANSNVKSTLDTFFTASSIEEKASVSRHPQRTLKHMEIYYAKEPFENLEVESVEVHPEMIDLGKSGTGVQARVVFTNQNEVVMMFERTKDDRYLLEWETLARFQRIPWEQYLNIRPQEAIDMHVEVGNGADEHPDIPADEYFGVRVKGWDKGAVRWTTAYIKRDDPNAEAFENAVSELPTRTDRFGNPSETKHYILKLRHTGDPQDPTKPLYIESIVSDEFMYQEDIQDETELGGEDVSYDDSSY